MVAKEKKILAQTLGYLKQFFECLKLGFYSNIPLPVSMVEEVPVVGPQHMVVGLPQLRRENYHKALLKGKIVELVRHLKSLLTWNFFK